MSATELIFLLVGRTGVGKSAVGNTILGRNLFESTSSPDSVTKEISIKSGEIKDCHITVVDTPGFIDTTMSTDQSKVKACEDIKKAMQMCPRNGKLAVIFVIKYGERQTNDNKNTLYILENIFGKENIWKSCIIVMTHGDCYDLCEENKVFQQYLKEQKGDFGEMFANCNYKCVLFHNKTKANDKKQQEEELQMLINCVNSLEQSFTRAKFEEAYKEQNRLELEGNLQNLKEYFEKKTQSYWEKINSLKFSSEALNELDNAEEIILQQLNSANELDAPEKIYYKEDEKRLLDDIRNSMLKLQKEVKDKKEDFRQKKIVQDLKDEIDDIKRAMMETDPMQENVFIFIQRMEENLKEKKKIKETIHKSDLRDSIEILTKSITEELNNLKHKAEECKVKEKMKEIQQSLNNLRTDDEAATQKIISLKQETETLMNNLVKQYKFIDKRCAKEIKSSLKTILQNISDKSETVHQFIKSEKIKIEIEKIQGMIEMADFTNEEIYSLINKLEEQLRSLEKSIEKEKLREQIKDNLHLLIRQAQQKLQSVQKQVQERKEMKLRSTLKTIIDSVHMTDCQGRDDSKILAKARSSIKSFLCKLDQEKDNVSKECFHEIKLEIKEIERIIGNKEARLQEYILTNELMSKINEITRSVNDIDLDESGSTEISKHKVNLTKLKKEIDEANISDCFVQLLHAALRNCDEQIFRVKKFIKHSKISKFNSEIIDVKHKISKMDITSESFPQETDQIKMYLKDLRQKINTENTSEDDKGILKTLIDSMEQDINGKSDELQKTKIEKEDIKKINDLTMEINTQIIVPEKINEFASGFERQLLTLEKEIKDSKLCAGRKENLFYLLQNARQILTMRKVDVEKTLASQFEAILYDIKVADSEDANISDKIYGFKDSLNQLNKKTEDKFLKLSKECEGKLNKLESRVKAFDEVNNVIETVVSDIKSLGIPCRMYHFDDFNKEVEKIKENISEKIQHKKDVQTLTLRTNRLVNEIEIKLKNNKRKLAGKILRFLPGLGPLIELAVTRGIDQEDRQQVINLSKKESTTK